VSLNSRAHDNGENMVGGNNDIEWM